MQHRKTYIDMAACATILWPQKADEGKAHCPPSHHALGMVYIPPQGGWRWLTFGEKPQKGETETEEDAVRAIRLRWGLY